MSDLEDDAQRKKYGALWPEELAPRTLFRCDRRALEPGEKLDRAKEDEDGVVVRYHPEARLRRSPQFWQLYRKWQSGIGKGAMTVEDWHHLTQFELDSFSVMRGAHQRELDRRKRQEDE